MVHRAMWWRSWILPGVLVVSSLGLYLANGRFVESTDTFGNELLPISILQHGTLTFDQYFAPAGPGGAYPTGDAAVAPGAISDAVAYRVAPDEDSKSIPWWFVRVGDHVVSLYPIAPGLLNTPTFFVASLFGIDLPSNVVPLTHITTSLIAAATVLAMYLCLKQVCRQQRTMIFLGIACACGTAVWSANSRSLYQHGAASLFITAALAALLSRRSWLVGIAGLLLGLAVVTRPVDGVIATILALYVLRYERGAFVRFALLGSLPLLALGWYSWTYWGTPLALGQGQGVDRFTAVEPLAATLGLLLSPNRGLLVFSPIFVFSAAAAILVFRQHDAPPLLRYVVWSSVALIGLYALWADWPGGHTYGYRYLIELVPGLMLLLAYAWPRLIEPRPALRVVFMVAFIGSIFVQGVGADAAPCGFDSDPNNIDFHHERLWSIADGEIARCAQREITAWQAALAPSAM